MGEKTKVASDYAFRRFRRKELRTTLSDETIMQAAAMPGEILPEAANGIAARL